MTSPWLRAAGIYFAFWIGMFLLGRVMHRASPTTGPEKRSAKEDALHALWLAWLFAAMPILGLFQPDPPFVHVFALAIGGALPLGAPHFLYRLWMRKKGDAVDG